MTPGAGETWWIFPRIRSSEKDLVWRDRNNDGPTRSGTPSQARTRGTKLRKQQPLRLRCWRQHRPTPCPTGRLVQPEERHEQRFGDFASNLFTPAGHEYQSQQPSPGTKVAGHTGTVSSQSLTTSHSALHVCSSARVCCLLLFEPEFCCLFWCSISNDFRCQLVNHGMGVTSATRTSRLLAASHTTVWIYLDGS